MQIQLQDGNKITIEDKPFAGGGEGDLHRVLQPDDYRPFVIKVYKPEKRTAQREQKLLYLQADPPAAVHFGDGHPTLVWVKDVVYANGKFLGFSMPHAMGEKLDLLCSQHIPKRFAPPWQRFARDNAASYELRLKICYNLASAVYQIHESGQYVLVDLKPENVLIQPNGLVSLVDLDSIEVSKEGKLLFPSAVNTPEYTPPEYYKDNRKGEANFEESWDRFCLAVIIYKILLGIHPYSSNNHKPPYHTFNTIEDMIKYGLFVHGSKRSFLGIIPPPHAGFGLVDREIRQLFLKCFEQGGDMPALRPTADAWCASLAALTGAPIPAGMFIKTFKVQEEKPPGAEVVLEWEMQDVAFAWLDGYGLVGAKGEGKILPLPDKEYTLQAIDAAGNIYTKIYSPRFRAYLPTYTTRPSFVHSRRRKAGLIAAVVMALLVMVFSFLWVGPRVGEYAAAAIVFIAIFLYAGRTYWLSGYYNSLLIKRKKEIEAALADMENDRPASTTGAKRAELEMLNREAWDIVRSFLDARKLLQQQNDNQIAALPQQKELLLNKEALQQANRKLMAIQQEEDSAYREQVQKARTEAMQKDMVTFGLQHQQIPGLSRNDVERLMEVGIFSAADFTEIRISNGDIILKNGKKVHAKGVGAIKAKALVAWKKRVVDHLNARMPDVQPDVQAVAALQLKYRKAKDKVQLAFAAHARKEESLKAALQIEKDALRQNLDERSKILLAEARLQLKLLKYTERAAILREAVLKEENRNADLYGQRWLLEKELQQYEGLDLKAYLWG